MYLPRYSWGWMQWGKPCGRTFLVTSRSSFRSREYKENTCAWVAGWFDYIFSKYHHIAFSLTYTRIPLWFLHISGYNGIDRKPCNKTLHHKRKQLWRCNYFCQHFIKTITSNISAKSSLAKFWTLMFLYCFYFYFYSYFYFHFCCIHATSMY